MRPKENWEKAQKDADRRRKRSSRKKVESDSMPSHRGSDASQGLRDGQSNASSPAPGPTDGAAEENANQMSPQLPVFRKPRALSVQLSPVTRENSHPEASAVIALQRAIQSSPARLNGTQSAPIDVEQLTPKPTRRLLFPSPPNDSTTKTASANKLPSARDLDFLGSHHRDSLSSVGQDSNDKENQPPPFEEDGPALDGLFEDGGLNLRPTTPTPTNKMQDSGMFKTPKNNVTPHRLPPTTGDFFSSTAKAILQHPTTPKRTTRSSSSQPLGEITPFTAHINQLFSEANGSPSADFDFPSLPSLHNTPGRMGNDYSFGNFDSQDFFSTDAAMPSSPPVWFGVYEDPNEQETNELLTDYQGPEDDGATNTSKQLRTADLAIEEHGRASVDTGAMA